MAELVNYSVYQKPMALEGQESRNATLSLVGVTDARTSRDAIEKLAVQTGHYIAIPTRYCTPVSVTVKVEQVRRVTIA